MRNVNVTTILRVAMTADDWQLYDKVGREKAASDLSKAVETQINCATNPKDAYDFSERVLALYASYGAQDTEGRAALAQLVALRFPKA